MEGIRNINDLRNSLLQNYADMKAGKMPIPLGKELSNAAGKIQSGAKLEMDYNKQTGNSEKKISFLEA